MMFFFQILFLINKNLEPEPGNTKAAAASKVLLAENWEAKRNEEQKNRRLCEPGSGEPAGSRSGLNDRSR